MTWAARKQHILTLLEQSPHDSLLRNELQKATGWPHHEICELVSELEMLGQIRKECKDGVCKVILMTNEHRAYHRASTS